jgi:hypothetical protein
MAFERQADYVAAMSRILSVSVVILLSLQLAVTSGAPAKRHANRWRGYGFRNVDRRPSAAKRGCGSSARSTSRRKRSLPH